VSKYVFSILKNYNENKSNKLFFITNGGDALHKLKQINLKPSIMKFTRGSKNIFDLLSNRKFLIDFCFQNKIDIIHTHHRYPEFLANLISGKTNIKTVTTVHSLVEGKSRYSFRSDKVIAVSNSVKNMLLTKFNVPEEKIVMIYNCIDQFENQMQLNIQNIKIELDIPSSAKILLFIGRITKIKGVDILIDAFNILKQRIRNLYLLILGTNYDNSININIENLSEGIILLKPVDNPYKYYSIADIVVLPSRVDPFPYVMLEAGLMKKPFIGSNTGGIGEFINDNINGLLVEPGNEVVLAEKIIYLLNNPEIGNTLANNLFEKVKNHNSCENYFNRLDKIYSDLLEK